MPSRFVLYYHYRQSPNLLRMAVDHAGVLRKCGLQENNPAALVGGRGRQPAGGGQGMDLLARTEDRVAAGRHRCHPQEPGARSQEKTGS